MNRPIEQALLSLLPTYNESLPPPLIELAGSLLTQSRHRVSTLKAEEEVGRLYACAHIACDRLKIPLDLPPIEPRPPIPPRIYKRLYTHLDKTLPASSSTTTTPGRAQRDTPGRVRTPSTKLRAAVTAAAGDGRGPDVSPSASRSERRRLPSRATPTKEKSLARFRTTATTPSKAAAAAATAGVSSSSDPLPRWIRPTLRYLCAELGSSAGVGAAVAAGMMAIVGGTRGRGSSGNEWVSRNMPALLGALYVYVWKSVEMPDGIDEERYVRLRRDVVETLMRGREVVVVPPSAAKKKKGAEEAGGDEEFWEGWRDIGPKDIDNAAGWVNRHGWLESDWAKAVEELPQRQEDGDDGDDTRMEGQEEEEAGHDEAEKGQVHARKADTMLQDRYDYLSERKQREFAAWKEGIMKRIAELERPPLETMTVDT